MQLMVAASASPSTCIVTASVRPHTPARNIEAEQGYSHKKQRETKEKSDKREEREIRGRSVCLREEKEEEKRKKKRRKRQEAHFGADCRLRSSW